LFEKSETFFFLVKFVRNTLSRWTGFSNARSVIAASSKKNYSSCSRGLLLMLFLGAVLAPAGARASVLIARVDRNGSCVGLLEVGDAILYLNSTPIRTTSDVHSFIGASRPNQTIIVTTQHSTAIVRLGGETRAKMGLGITNVNKSVLFDETVHLSRPRLPSVERPSPKGQAVVLVALAVCLIAAGLASTRESSTKLLRRTWNAIGRSSGSRDAAWLFVLSFCVRGVYSLAYLVRFGFHSANVLELWFYVDVAKGNRGFLSPFDPTVYVLRFFGILSPEKVPFYATVICAVSLASLAPVLVYILVRDLHGPKAGFLSGLVYGLLVQPITLSTVSFTHHLVQIPLSLAFLILSNRAIASRGKKRVAYVFSAVLIAVVDYFVNVEIFVYAVIAYFLVLAATLRWMLKEKGMDSQKAFAIIMLGIVIVLVPVHVYFDDIVSTAISLTPKQQAAEGEVELIHPPNLQFVTALPLPNVVYLRFYGVFLLLIPFGVYVAFERRDLTPFLLLALGVLVSLHWTRGSRLTDIGVACLAGLALANWREEWALATGIVALPLSVLFLVYLPFTYLQQYFIICAGLFVAAFLVKKVKWPKTLALGAAIAYSLAVCTTGLLILELPQSTEAEYDALTWLSQHSHPGEKIITSLDRGHLPEAIAGLDSVSDEYEPRPEIAKAFFETEELAARTLAEYNVSYVMVTSDDLRVGSSPDGTLSVNVGGYITYQGHLSQPEIPLVLVFRLTYPDGNLRYFEELYVSRHGGTTVRIYRLRRDLLEVAERPEARRRTTLSMILRNPNGEELNAHIPLAITDSSGTLVALDSVDVTLGANETRSLAIDYALRPREGLKLELFEEQFSQRRTGSWPVSGYVWASGSGLAVFRCLTASGTSYEFASFVRPGLNLVSQEVEGLGREDPIIAITIDHEAGPKIRMGVTRASFAWPPSRLEPVQIVFSEID